MKTCPERNGEGQHIKNETAEPGDGLAVSHLQIRETVEFGGWGSALIYCHQF